MIFQYFNERLQFVFFGSAILSVLIVVAIYLFLWKRRLGDFIVYLLEFFLQMEHEEAFQIYHNNFRGYKEIFFTVAIITIFLLLLLFLFRWISRYFKEINGGIDNLLEDDESKICLSREVDINGATYDLYFWLQENSYKYGFIFRYPAGKTDVTGTAEEVWHYRYVGVEVATEMYEQGLCLEEYLDRIEK